MYTGLLSHQGSEDEGGIRQYRFADHHLQIVINPCMCCWQVGFCGNYDGFVVSYRFEMKKPWWTKEMIMKQHLKWRNGLF